MPKSLPWKSCQHKLSGKKKKVVLLPLKVLFMSISCGLKNTQYKLKINNLQKLKTITNGTLRQIVKLDLKHWMKKIWSCFRCWKHACLNRYFC